MDPSNPGPHSAPMVQRPATIQQVTAVSSIQFDEEIRRIIETSEVGVLDSYVAGSRLHEILNNPYEEGYAEG